MKLWSTITANYYLNVAIVAWVSAQLIKTILTLISSKTLKLERLVGSGGMPSSHTSFTVSITVAMARKLGIASPEFALAFAFAAVVMYDAMGVRRAAGEQAKVLNKMIFEFSDFPWLLKKDKKQAVEVSLEQLEKLENKKGEPLEEEIMTIGDEPIVEKELKEYLGHTPLEVVGGCLLGIIIALLIPMK